MHRCMRTRGKVETLRIRMDLWGAVRLRAQKIYNSCVRTYARALRNIAAHACVRIKNIYAHKNQARVVVRIGTRARKIRAYA